MFQQRLKTAVCLVALVLIGLFFTPKFLLFLIALGFFVTCLAEFVNLIPLNFKSLPSLFFMVASFLTATLVYYVTAPLFIASILCWTYLTVAIIRFPESQKNWGTPLIVSLLGGSLVSLGLVSLSKIYLLAHGEWLTLYFLLLVWLTDTGAYCFGKLFGQHKLIPKVSPGKTVEGLLGGLLTPLLLSIVIFIYHPTHPLLWFLQAILTIAASMVGDLAISMFKRRVNCKDTGAILPGHGGLLDRLDSLLASAPFFYGIQLLLSH